jgi:biotin carboxyl carrier protein
MKVLVTVDGRPGELVFERGGKTTRFQYFPERGEAVDREASVIEVEPGIFSLLLNGRSIEVKVVDGPDGYYVDLAGRRSVVQVRDPRSLVQLDKRGVGEGRQTINAPMPGKVVRVLVKEGDRVEAGDGLVVVEAMKMQNELKAPRSAKVMQVKAAVGATVGMGEMLVAIE